MIKYTSIYFEPYKLEKKQEEFIKECKQLLKECNYKYSDKIKYKIKKIMKRFKK